MLRWAVMVVLSIALSALFTAVHLPGALLFGPMLGAMLLEIKPGKVHIPKVLHAFAQAMIGCLIARAFTPAIFITFAERWPLYLAAVASTVLASIALGYFFSRARLIPDTTAIWGLLPGAASAMMVMAEDFGADARLVAFMQYLRVVCVGTTASLVARFWVDSDLAAKAPHVVHTLAARPDFFAPVHWLPLIYTLVIAFAGVWLGPRLAVPAATLLIPMVVGAAFNLSGLFAIELPQWLLAFSYALLGWTIGTRFTREVFIHAWRIFPQTLLAIFLLIGSAAGLAFLLVKVAGIDPLSAYLATSPGGMDSIAIIAANSHVDLPFIMALQTVRFLMVLLLGPPASRFVAQRMVSTVKPAHDQALIAQVAEDEGDLD